MRTAKTKTNTLEECFAPPYPCAHEIILRRSVPAGEAPYKDMKILLDFFYINTRFSPLI